MDDKRLKAGLSTRGALAITHSKANAFFKGSDYVFRRYLKRWLVLESS
jgi:hypothetical protein